MAELNHFAISAALGSTLGPTVPVHHGQLGSLELAATIGALKQRRSAYIDDLENSDSVSEQYEKAVKRAFLLVRDDYSSDKVVADPVLAKKFIRACRDLGLDDSVFR